MIYLSLLAALLASATALDLSLADYRGRLFLALLGLMSLARSVLC